MNHKAVPAAVAALVGGLVLLPEGVAHAANACSTYVTSAANTVYITGSSAVEPLLQLLANELAALTPPISIIYQKPTTASCGGLVDVTTAVPDTSSGYYLDPTATPAAAVGCTTGSGVNVDIGVSDVFASTCNGVTLGAAQYDFVGTVGPMEFAVPFGSSQNVISQDAAYTVLGWGGLQYAVTPWTTWSDIFVRNSSSGTELIIAGAIGLSPAFWLASAPDGGVSQQYTSSTPLLSALQDAAASAPNAAIGILASAYVDPNKTAAVLGDGGAILSGGIKPLAFQAKGQDCGYFADSTQSALDKINVRQGRYAPWGPTHWVTNTTPSDGATPIPVGVNGNSAAVAQVIAFVTHAASLSEAQDAATITAEARSSFVPQCAMQVSRSAEVTVDVSGESSYQPPKGCGCFFESVVNGGTPVSTYCQPCGGTDAAACPTAYSKCNYGFCEVQ
jgi:ABC-type phosphate transport system substrate-binding protein